MPTPRTVFGLNSRQDKWNKFLTALQIIGVARGTTLHTPAPSNRTAPTSFRTTCLAEPSNHPAVEILACRITLASFANPRCVLVLPMSKRRIMPQCQYGVVE